MKLFKRNAAGKPVEWAIEENRGILYISYGVFDGKKTKEEVVITKRNEFQSRINQKRKEGYKELIELYDNAPTYLESKLDLKDYLNTYLPKFNTGASGEDKVMLAKTFEYGKAFNIDRIGQPKINGLRCYIGAVLNNGDMFKPINLIFRSREGAIWNMPYMEEYLLEIIPKPFLDEMIECGTYLDGEIYLPGHTINEINHFVKDKNCLEHKLLQFWCYDLIVENVPQYKRFTILNNTFHDFFLLRNYRDDSKSLHLNNKSRFVLLNTYAIINDAQAIKFRDAFIDYGYEGLILRDANGTYQYGKRNNTMIKFKRKEDGLFKIIDIIPEGIKRSNLPKFICKNDINDETFESKILGDFNSQAVYLTNKDKYIGKYLKVEYRERSGVKQTPFHYIGLEVV
jgi:hypothetical protein